MHVSPDNTAIISTPNKIRPSKKTTRSWKHMFNGLIAVQSSESGFEPDVMLCAATGEHKHIKAKVAQDKRRNITAECIKTFQPR